MANANNPSIRTPLLMTVSSAEKSGEDPRLNSSLDVAPLTDTPDDNGTICQRLCRILPNVLLGQFLASLIAITAVTSGLIVKEGASYPLLQNVPHYILLALVFTPMLIRNCLRPAQDATEDSGMKRKEMSFRSEWWKYLLASVLDVHANWGLVTAYTYTNVVSIQVLDCLSIASCMILSRIFFKVIYKCLHFVAILGCLVGVGLMIWSDFSTMQSQNSNQANITNGTATLTEGNRRAIIGDFIVVASALAYGASNVLQEHLCHDFGSVNYLSISSLLSAAMQLIYFLAIELTTLKVSQFSSMAIGCYAGYASAMFIVYVTMSYLLPLADSVFANLSILTADFYALIFGIVIFSAVFTWQYFFAFLIIILSVTLFVLVEPYKDHSQNNVNNNA